MTASGPLLCTSCGARVSVPGDRVRAKVRCGACGYYVDVPAELRSVSEVEERRPARPDAPRKRRAKPPPIIEGTQDEDDGRPYTVPGDPLKKCTACFKEIDLEATFCVHCGTELTSGRKAKKSYEAFERRWEPRWNFDLRLKVFLGLQVINVLLVAVSGMTSGISGALYFLVFQVGLQAFLLGTYEAVAVKRTSKGSATIERIWRVCFVQRPPLKVEWKRSAGVGIIAIHNPGLLEWFTLISLLVPAVLPGILFYWYVIRPDRFQVALCDEYGSTNEVIFRTTDRDQAEEICRSISDAAGLWYRPVM